MLVGFGCLEIAVKISTDLEATMADLKTKLNDGSVTDFLNGVADEQKRQDSFTLLQMMEQITGEPGKMWGDSIVGFGSYHYKYASGREGDMPVTGFSPRKQDLTLYIMGGLEQHEALLKKLGKHRTGKSCLYLKRLKDIDLEALSELIRRSVEQMRGVTN